MSKELTRVDVENQCDLLATVGIDMLVQVSISRAWRDHDAAQRATIQQLEARIVSLETDVDRMAWKISPAMAQATIDQLVKRNEQLEAQVKALESELKAWHNGNGGIVKLHLDSATDSC